MSSKANLEEVTSNPADTTIQSTSDIQKHQEGVNSSDSFNDGEKLPFAEDDLSEEAKESEVNALAEELGVNQKKLMWKIDLMVVPSVLILYFLAFLDRVNVSNAKVYGLDVELNLVGHQFNTALTIFFVPYILFEVFSNYFLKLFKPNVWLTGSIVLFGAVTIGMGFVHNYGALIACRFLLGLFESSTFPGIFYLLASYYTKYESQRRFSFFFSSTCLAGAAGGAIAFRINDLDGVHGLSSWRWIFIIEGTITVGIGLFVLFWWIPDFPEGARFLSTNEREFIKKKLEIFSVKSGYDTKFGLSDILPLLKDPFFGLAALCYFGLIIPSYGYAYFAPTIIKQMGYTAVAANQHSVYPWLAAFGFGNICAYFSDRLKIRAPFAIFSTLLAVIGLALILGLPNTPMGRYAGCFLVTQNYTAMPILVCWTSLNFGGHLRKSFGTAFQIGFGNIGGIIATFVFLSKDAPRYVTGLSVSIAFDVFAAIFMVILLLHFQRMNRKKQTVEYREKFFSQDERAIVLQGDLHPNFKYAY